jgi:predicted nucleotidyltransferase
MGSGWNDGSWLRRARFPVQNAAMTSASALQLDARLPAMAGMITAAIPGSEIRLFGSRAKGNAGPDSDIDLLITAPDSWLQTHNRYKVLAELRRQLGRSDVSLDLLLYSVSEVLERKDWLNHVIARAYREGLRLDGLT